MALQLGVLFINSFDHGGCWDWILAFNAITKRAIHQLTGTFIHRPQMPEIAVIPFDDNKPKLQHLQSSPLV